MSGRSPETWVLRRQNELTAVVRGSLELARTVGREDCPALTPAQVALVGEVVGAALRQGYQYGRRRARQDHREGSAAYD